MRRWLIEKLGGFPDLDGAIIHLKKMDDLPRKNQVLTEAVKHLFNTISAEDVLRQNEKGEWVFQGKLMLPAEMAQLRDEAAILRAMRLWRVLKMDIKYQLNKKMFEESTITADVLWGKLILFYDDIIRTRLQQMK